MTVAGYLRRAAVLLVVFSLAGLASAQPGAAAVKMFWPGLSAQQKLAVEIGFLWWGGIPDECERVTVETTLEAPDRRWGEAEQRWYRGQNDCVIRFAPQIATAPFSLLCRTAIHEAGHLWGLDHGDDPMMGGSKEPVVVAPCDSEPFRLHEAAIRSRRLVCPRLKERRERRGCWAEVRRYRHRIKPTYLTPPPGLDSVPKYIPNPEE